MTTPTSISDGETQQRMSGLPDEATLTRLANQFFAALPGAVAGMPASTAAAEAATPVAVDTLARESAAPGPAIGSEPQPTLGAAPRGPLSPPEPIGAPIHPYYFLTESRALAPSSAAAAAAVATIPPETAPASLHAPEVPGERQLEVLLTELGEAMHLTERAPDSPATPLPPRSHFYFLDGLSLTDARSAAAPQPTGHPAFDVYAVRHDFPILAERVNGRPLIWFDNAATTHKPQAVIDRLAYFYRHENSNIHRAAHELAARATDAYEAARSKVARFLGAASSEEIVFVRGTTEGINLVAQSWGRANVGAGDEIVLSHLEHHANIVPWQRLAQERGAKLRVIPVDDSGQILLDAYRAMLNEHTKIVAISQVSNALGTVTPLLEVIDSAHRAGALVLVDGAQAVSHRRVDVQALGADFYVFSGHKLFAPTGIGVVYGRRELLNTMPPWQGGGNMISDVTFERTIYQPAPTRFEAGTSSIGDAVALGAAIDYIERWGLENIGRYEHELLRHAIEGMNTVPGLRLIGTARDKVSVQSFVLDGYTPEEVGTSLNREGIAVRAGHHCAQPIMRRFGLEATVRPSFAFYNTCAEIDVFIKALHTLAYRAVGSVR